MAHSVRAMMIAAQIAKAHDFAGADERRLALAHVNEAFAEAVLAGVEGGCFAQAAIEAGLYELVARFGEDAVADFAQSLPERVRQGEFSSGAQH